MKSRKVQDATECLYIMQLSHYTRNKMLCLQMSAEFSMLTISVCHNFIQLVELSVLNKK